MRYTRDDVERNFELLLQILGGRRAESPDDTGAYFIEKAYNSIYTVYRITESHYNAGDGSHCIAHGRRNVLDQAYTAREFCEYVNFAWRVSVEIYDNRTRGYDSLVCHVCGKEVKRR